MTTQIIILVLLLLVINLGWLRAEVLRKKDEALQYAKLRLNKQERKETFTEDELKDEIEPKHIYTWPRAIAICLDIWILGAVFTHLWANIFFDEVDDTNSKRALFGDSFGAVNALISAFAFAGMLVAFFLQRYKLRLQRKELQLTRDEMNEQTIQFKKQNDTLQRERFEMTFFNMLGLQQQIVNELSTNQTEEIRRDLWDGFISYSKDFPVDEKISGRNLFYHAFCNIIHEIQHDSSESIEKLRGMKSILETYGFEQYTEMTTPTYFDHYFRHLYTILNFIDRQENTFTQEERYHYAKILRATLSRYELVWLYYYGLSDYGNEKLKPLIEKYCMMKNLRVGLLCCCKENRQQLENAGMDRMTIQDEGFTGTDFEFNLTFEQGNKLKYHISAFYNTFQEQEKGRALVNKWMMFL